MSCCGALGKMDLIALQSFTTVKIQVVTKGFGVKPGVYELGKDLRDDVVLRLLNNRNAKLLEFELKNDTTKRVDEEPVSTSSANEQEKVRRPRKSTKTRRTNRNKSEGSKKTRSSRSRVSSGSKRQSTDNGSSPDPWEDS